MKVHVSVTDNKNGTLSAAATYDGEKAVPTFTNSKPTADATIEATKILKGKDLTLVRSLSAYIKATRLRLIPSRLSRTTRTARLSSSSPV